MSETVRSARSGEYAGARRGGIDAWEIAFIEQKREQGIPVSAIANMLGRPITDVRLVPPPLRLQLVALAPEPPPKAAKPPNRNRARRGGPRNMPQRVRVLVTAVAQRYSYTLDDLKGDGRTRDLCEARHEAFALIRELRKPGTLAPSYSWSLIASWFGGRDHTTVMNGVSRHWQRMSEAAA